MTKKNKCKGCSSEPRFQLHEILVENSPCSGQGLAERLIDAGLLAKKCLICGTTGESLFLKRFNDNRKDNRLHNLYLSCKACISSNSLLLQSTQHNCSDCGRCPK